MMVLVILLSFLIIGARVNRVDRWVASGLAVVIAGVILFTYARF